MPNPTPKAECQESPHPWGYTQVPVTEGLPGQHLIGDSNILEGRDHVSLAHFCIYNA